MPPHMEAPAPAVGAHVVVEHAREDEPWVEGFECAEYQYHDPSNFVFADTKEFFLLAFDISLYSPFGPGGARTINHRAYALRARVADVPQSDIDALTASLSHIHGGAPPALDSDDAYKQYHAWLQHNLPLYYHVLPEHALSAINEKLRSRFVSSDTVSHAVHIALALSLIIDGSEVEPFLPLISAIVDVFNNKDIGTYPRIVVPCLLILCRLLQFDAARRAALSSKALRALLSLTQANEHVQTITLYRLCMIANVLEKLSRHGADFVQACRPLRTQWWNLVGLLPRLPNQRDGKTEVAQQALLRALRPLLREFTGVDVAVFFHVLSVRRAGTLALAALHAQAPDAHYTAAEVSEYHAWRQEFETPCGMGFMPGPECQRVFEQLRCAADFICDELTKNNGGRLVNHALKAAQWGELLGSRCSLAEVMWIKRLARRAQSHVTDDDSAIKMSRVARFFERQAISEQSDHTKASLLQCMSDLLRCVTVHAVDFTTVRPLLPAVEGEVQRLGAAIIEPCAHILDCLLQSQAAVEDAAALLLTTLRAIRKTQQWHMYDLPVRSAHTIFAAGIDALSPGQAAAVLQELVHAHPVMLRAAAKLTALRVLHLAYHHSDAYAACIVTAADGPEDPVLSAIRAGLPAPPLAFPQKPRPLPPQGRIVSPRWP